MAFNREENPEQIVKDILIAIGENPERPGLVDTPKRVVESWKELFSGYNINPKEILSVSFGDTEEYDEMIILKNIKFNSFCEHHLLPFCGVASVAYVPRNKVVGISKLARLVECFSNRLQIQERLTKQISNSLKEHLDPLGCMVVISATHSCMTCRGIKKQDSKMITSSIYGVFKKAKVREEFFSLINMG